MEQNQVSDEELIKKLNKILNESIEEKKRPATDVQKEDSFGEKFHDVYETTDQQAYSTTNNATSEVQESTGEPLERGPPKDLILQNQYLSLQLQAEKKKSKELQTKFKLFENSVKYFERLNGQLETIKRAVDEDFTDQDKVQYNLETMQKIRPKTIHTAATSGLVSGTQDGAENFCEQPLEDKTKVPEEKEEVVFRDAEDFKYLEQGLEIIKDKKKNNYDLETEKVFITKTEKRCLEDIGNLAARTRTPVDDKHQRFFEKDRRKFAHSIAMPDIQEVDKSEAVPPEIISKTNEAPVNITRTELDGLRSYLLQLKELIARRETAWARTTERDYNQRVEITRFKNEVGRLRMLCEKRQRDIKERDQIIAAKDEEIKELQKRVQGLRNVVMKLEKKDERLMDTLDGMTHEALENSHIVQRSYNAMKRHSLMNRSNVPSNMNIPHTKPPSKSKDSIIKKPKSSAEKTPLKRSRTYETTRPEEEEEWKVLTVKSRQKNGPKEKPKSKHKSEVLMTQTKETYEKVDEKLQRVEEMLHHEVLKEARKLLQPKRDASKFGAKNLQSENSPMDLTTSSKKLTPSNSTIRQEMLTAMTGLNPNATLSIKTPGFPDPKKNQATASIIANALLTARNSNVFNPNRNLLLVNGRDREHSGPRGNKF